MDKFEKKYNIFLPGVRTPTDWNFKALASYSSLKTGDLGVCCNLLVLRNLGVGELEGRCWLVRHGTHHRRGSQGSKARMAAKTVAENSEAKRIENKTTNNCLFNKMASSNIIEDASEETQSWSRLQRMASWRKVSRKRLQGSIAKTSSIYRGRIMEETEGRNIKLPFLLTFIIKT